MSIEINICYILCINIYKNTNQIIIQLLLANSFGVIIDKLFDDDNYYLLYIIKLMMLLLIKMGIYILKTLIWFKTYERF